MERIKTTEIRKNLSETLNQVIYCKKQIILQRRGNDVAVVVPIEDFTLLECFKKEEAEAKKVGGDCNE